MQSKEYFNQASRINQLIDTKLEQIQSLRELSSKATYTLSGVPSSGTRNVQQMEGIICKIVDLENEILHDIEALVDLKRNISNVIRSLENPDYRIVLELRYLCFKKWDEIAHHFHFAIRHVHRIHAEALAVCSEKINDVTIIC